MILMSHYSINRNNYDLKNIPKKIKIVHQLLKTQNPDLKNQGFR